jgi:hydrogenase maturation factor
VTRVLPTGKLPLDELRPLLARVGSRDPRVAVGPQPGEDAAVIEFGDRALVVATDPVTFAADRIGWYAVHVNANDVAVLGARPAWFFVVLLLPERGTTPALVDAIMADVDTACRQVGATVCGGHTEITQGLDRPIVVGQMLGEVVATRLIRKTRLQPGDQLLLTQGVAIEGTAILARERRERLDGHVAPDVLTRAAGLLIDPGISIVRAALVAAEAGGDAVHAMHDPTEGGVATALVELVAPAGLGLRVARDRIPILPETRAVCATLDLDPLALLASGALLIGVAPDGVENVLEALGGKGVPVCRVGEVRPADDGLTIVVNGTVQPLAPPARDEIARALDA